MDSQKDWTVLFNSMRNIKVKFNKKYKVKEEILLKGSQGACSRSSLCCTAYDGQNGVSPWTSEIICVLAMALILVGICNRTLLTHLEAFLVQPTWLPQAVKRIRT